MLSPQSEFVWNQDLNDAFERSKKEIIESVKNGVKTFDPKRTTCLAIDGANLELDSASNKEYVHV